MMTFIFMVLAILFVMGLWLMENTIGKGLTKVLNKGARLVGPLMSISASGTVAKTLTYGSWRGVNYVREYFIPSNPQSTTQTNVRLAWFMAVEEWTDTLTTQQKDAYIAGAAGQPLSGFNLYMKRAMDEYMLDLGSALVPGTVVTTGDYPAESIVWTEAV